MNVRQPADAAISRIATAIGEPARARILYCLMDGHARTSTELSVVAEVSPSTASVHLNLLKMAHLVKVCVQGRHRFYTLDGPPGPNPLKSLSVSPGPGAFGKNSCRTRPGIYAPHGLATITLRVRWGYRCMIASRHSGGC